MGLDTGDREERDGGGNWPELPWNERILGFSSSVRPRGAIFTVPEVDTRRNKRISAFRTTDLAVYSLPDLMPVPDDLMLCAIMIGDNDTNMIIQPVASSQFHPSNQYMPKLELPTARSGMQIATIFSRRPGTSERILMMVMIHGDIA
jgi:hypothetical protein